MSKKSLPKGARDVALREIRGHLKWAARKIYSASRYPKPTKSTKSNKSKVARQKAGKNRKSLESVFYPAITCVFQNYNYSDLAISLLFFIEKEFGLKFRITKTNRRGFFYGKSSGNWERQALERFNSLEALSAAITKCSEFSITSVPEDHKRKIRALIQRHSFGEKQSEKKKDDEKGAGSSKSRRRFKEFEGPRDRLGALSKEQRRLTPEEYFTATADFPDEASGLINFSICRTDECTLQATKRDYKRFEVELENRSSHQLIYERLEQVFQLSPTRRYWGRNAYIGYTALEFQDCSKVLLTSPIYGNAVYILSKHEWRDLTNRFRKEEIRYKFPNKSTTFNHEGAWLLRVKRELQKKSFG